jgi:hypothetical protein
MKKKKKKLNKKKEKKINIIYNINDKKIIYV